MQVHVYQIESDKSSIFDAGNASDILLWQNLTRMCRDCTVQFAQVNWQFLERKKHWMEKNLLQMLKPGGTELLDNRPRASTKASVT